MASQISNSSGSQSTILTTTTPQQTSRGLSIADLLNTPPSTPKRAKKSDLSRDDRIRIQALHSVGGLAQSEIVQQTGFSIDQVRRACNGPATPQRPKQRRPAIRTPERLQLKQWIQTGRNRYIPIYQLPLYLPPPLNRFGEVALSRAIKDLGGHSIIRPRRIRLTQRQTDERLVWCRTQIQLRPRPEDWEDVLFSDETWAKNDPMWKKRGILFDEEDPEDIEDWALRKRRPDGWMFWGSFAGRRKGPTFVWEKKYGGIDSVKYIRHILPLLQEFFSNEDNANCVFQQDNAPSHRSKKTTAALQAAGIPILRFPTYSPDLTPIENVWPWMKDYIEIRYDVQELSLNELHPVVMEAWDAVPDEFLLRLAHSMPRRLQMCIERGGRQIDY